MPFGPFLYADQFLKVLHEKAANKCVLLFQQEEEATARRLQSGFLLLWFPQTVH